MMLYFIKEPKTASSRWSQIAEKKTGWTRLKTESEGKWKRSWKTADVKICKKASGLKAKSSGELWFEVRRSLHNSACRDRIVPRYSISPRWLTCLSIFFSAFNKLCRSSTKFCACILSLFLGRFESCPTDEAFWFHFTNTERTKGKLRLCMWL